MQTLQESRNFQGQACFARLLGASEDGQFCLMERLWPIATDLEFIETVTIRSVRLRDALWQCFAGNLAAKDSFMRRLSCVP